MINQQLTNIHIRMNGDRLAKYARTRGRPSRRLRLAHPHRRLRHILPTLWDLVKGPGPGSRAQLDLLHMLRAVAGRRS